MFDLFATLCKKVSIHFNISIFKQKIEFIPKIMYLCISKLSRIEKITNFYKLNRSVKHLIINNDKRKICMKCMNF